MSHGGLLALATALLLSPGALAAQEDPMVSSLKGLHDVTRSNIMQTAELVDEELFAFRPSEDVRTLGQILAHVANAQLLFCSSAAGERSPATENFEETRTTKAAIIEALQTGFEYCDRVYAGLGDADASRSVPLFGDPNTIGGILAFNSAHNYEHYGNLVTYMRINGIVPPSSR